MQNKLSLKNEIDFISDLRDVLHSYQEVSVGKMQRIRKAVVSTRDFVESISEVFVDVKNSYKEAILKLQKKHKYEEISLLTLLPKNGKHVAVFISSDEKIYGEIEKEVFNVFSKFILTNECDVLILGRIGLEMLRKSGIKKPYQYYDIDGEYGNSKIVRSVAYYLANYTVINAFYGKFVSIMTQIPINMSLSGDTNLLDNTLNNSVDEKKHEPFLFDPSVEKIMQFFEKQVFMSIFNQALRESELARHASRIKILEDSLINIEKKTLILSNDKRRANHLFKNKKQLETLSGMQMWKS